MTTQMKMKMKMKMKTKTTMKATTATELTRAAAFGVGLLAMVALASCDDAPPVLVWVDGFAPDHVTFDVEDLGALDDAALAARAKSADIDGVSRVNAGACAAEKGGVCRAALLTVFVNNRGTEPIPPPVVRLAVPQGQSPRLPIAFGAHQIDRGRTGRVRSIVQLYPGE